MKVLYAIQGTGNGHIARAAEIIPAFKKRVETDILVSGTHSEIPLGHRIRYRLNGLGFRFGKHGGIDLFNTWWYGDVPRFFREIDDLDLSEYDLVVNDFEPVSARAALRQEVPCVGLSNQCTLLDPRISKPEEVSIGHFTEAVFKHYAPVDICYGFHYNSVDRFVSTPVIRSEIRNARVSHGNHYVVYLPFYSDEKIIAVLHQFPQKRWVVFSKHGGEHRFAANVEIVPVSGGAFTECLASCEGVFCSAGFGITTEALFLGKKLLVMPMKRQFEQICNVHSLAGFGVPSIKSLKKEHHGEIAQWLSQNQTVQVHYPDNAQQIADRILTDFAEQNEFLDQARKYGRGRQRVRG